MSFMGESACATGANPLAQMVKQQNVDRSMQYDRMQGSMGPGSLRDGRAMSQADQQMLQKMDQAPGAQGFRFDDMRQELHNLPGAGPSQSNWAADFREQPNFTREASPAGGAWASEFGTSSPGPQQQQQAPQGQPQGYNSYNGSRFGGPRFLGSGITPQFARANHMQHQHQQQPQASQSKVVELDDATWEQQFKSIEESQTQSGESKASAGEAQAKTVDEASEIKEVTVEELMEEKELGIEDGVDPRWFESQQFPENWDAVWERIKDKVDDATGGLHTRAGEGEIWDRDFDAFASARPDFADYKFQENNPYLNEDDPFATGVQLMDHGAKLSLAVLCFEAALQRDPMRVEAWSRLGAAQAQNEYEPEAIAALEQAVKLDPRNQQALMDLSVSYINEGYENAAYATLERWLAMKYPDLVTRATSENPALSNENRIELHARVTDLFIKAAQMSPDGANIDADVQVGLGVLFYGSGDYDKAVDCFKAALAVRPDDPLLWNRLGATLANSNRAEEAIDAYYQALNLRPSFVRARYNVGVSFINIGCYKEAAEHLLAALSLHLSPEGSQGGDSSQSSNLQETLRRVFLAMDRRDLVEKIGKKIDVDQFRNEFTF